MAKNIKNLGRDLKKLFENKIVKGSQTRFQKAVNRASERVIYFTPIDTGLAKGNWQAFLNQPIQQSVLRYGASASIPSNFRVIRSFNIMKDKSIFLTNNLAYIVPLNEEHSQQAPIAGWVQREIKAGFKEGAR